MFLKFPKDFMWGSAMSALQSEGSGVTKSGKHMWNLIVDQRPEAVYGQASPYMAVDSTRHFKEDLGLMAKYGHNSFRNSFSWARLFPDGKNADKKAVAYYHSYLQEAKRLGLKRIMTLMHFDIPEFMYKKGGFLSPDYPQSFLKYADFVFGEFGNEVEIFATYNEPNPQVSLEVLFGMGWPELKNNNQAFLDAAVGLIHSHALAVNLFNSKYKKKTGGKISFVHAATVAVPKDEKNFSPEDEKATNDLLAVSNYLWMDPMINGKFGTEILDLVKRLNLKLNVSAEAMAEINKVQLDAVGLNQYTVARTAAPQPGGKHIYEMIASGYKLENARMNKFRGWEIYPKGVYIVTQLVKKRYGNIPSWIGENGMGAQEEWRFLNKNGVIADDYRIAFLSEHLEWIHKSIAEGANCMGYHMWSTYDCWSMANGYKNTYGFFRVDLNTMKRSPKKSAFWLEKVKQANGFEGDYKKLEEVTDFSKINVVESANFGHRVLGASPEKAGKKK